jgi:hypothetical protein
VKTHTAAKRGGGIPSSSQADGGSQGELQNLRAEAAAHRNLSALANGSEGNVQLMARHGLANQAVVQRNPLNWIAEKAGVAAGYAGAAVSGVAGLARGAYQGLHDDPYATRWEAATELARQGFDEGYERPAAPALGLAAVTGGAAAAFLGGATAGLGTLTLLGGAAYKTQQARKTEIEHTADYVCPEGPGLARYMVGKKMIARLDASDAVKGSATGANWTWMQGLSARFPKAGIVRGHLLNHDLGGFGTPDNLYPISNQANQEHSSQVEHHVKGLLAQELKDRTNPAHAPMRLNYIVEVKEAVAHDPKQARFECSYYFDGGRRQVYPVHSSLGFDKGGGYQKHLNPLSNSPWFHGARRGFEDADTSQSLQGYKDGRKIRSGRPLTETTEANVDAVYKPGMSAAMDHNYGILEQELFNHIKPWVLKEIANNLDRTVNFKASLLNTVYNDPWYQSIKADATKIRMLMLSKVKEAITEVDGQYFQDPDSSKALALINQI